jgi:hypothetical protein
MEEITDDRAPSHFRTKTFSDFRRGDVYRELLKMLLQGTPEPANYWAAELVASGHIVDWWHAVIEAFATHIHVANVKLIAYLVLRCQLYKRLAAEQSHISDNLMWTRNNQQMRMLVAEVTTIVAVSRKSPRTGKTTVPKCDLAPDVMQSRFAAPSCDFAAPVILPDDPREIFIPLNEFAHAIHEDSPNTHAAIYWFEWLLEYEATCKRQKAPIACHRRPCADVADKYRGECVWPVWDAIAAEAHRSRPPVIVKLAKEAHEMFCFEYTRGKGRKHLVYFAIKLLTQTITLEDTLVDNPASVAAMMESIPNLYRQIGRFSNLVNLTVADMDDEENT